MTLLTSRHHRPDSQEAARLVRTSTLKLCVRACRIALANSFRSTGAVGRFTNRDSEVSNAGGIAGITPDPSQQRKNPVPSTPLAAGGGVNPCTGEFTPVARLC